MKKRSILFVVTFGAGLGHLARELGIASKLAEGEASIEIVFFTTSPATSYLYEEGYHFYYIPDRMFMPKNATSAQWDQLFSDHLSDIITIHKPDLVVFDGAYPPNGFLRCRMRFKEIRWIWVKREGDRKDIRSVEDYERFFEYLIIPMELGTKNRAETKNCKVVDPIIYEPARTGKKEWLRALAPVHNKENVKIWYVQLGAGLNKEITKERELVLKALQKKKDVLILLGDSPVGKRQNHYDATGVITLCHFPNSIYFPYINYAISAAGYNTFYELLYYCIPSVFIPNRNTTKDDQLARAKRADTVLQTGKCLDNFSELEEKLEAVEKESSELVKRCTAMHFTNGAVEAAKILFDLIK